MHDYLCERSDILDRIESDRDFFYEFLKFQINKVCFSQTRLKASLSLYNVTEAHGLIIKDTKRVTKIENLGDKLEQYKRAAFIAYWIRRLSPISTIISPADLRSDRLRNRKERFLGLYANEFCPFDIGYRLCRFVASRDQELDNNQTDYRAMLAVLGGNPAAISPQDIRYYTLTEKHVHDVCALLKEKQVSPHALYLLYSAYFSLPTKRTRTV